jgi:hypothetical protein
MVDAARGRRRQIELISAGLRLGETWPRFRPAGSQLSGSHAPRLRFHCGANRVATTDEPMQPKGEYRKSDVRLRAAPDLPPARYMQHPCTADYSPRTGRGEAGFPVTAPVRVSQSRQR